MKDSEAGSTDLLEFYKGKANNLKAKVLEFGVALMLLRSEGYYPRYIDRRFDSDEVDIISEKGMGRSMRVVVCECKNVRKDRVIGRNDVDRLVQRVRRVRAFFYRNEYAAFEGRYYTTSVFDESAKRFAGSVKKFQITLVDGKKLDEVFAQSGVRL